MKKFIIEVVILMVLLTGCSQIEVSDESNILYSRSCVNSMCTSKSFGKGRNDDIYVALKYVYESEAICELYGDSFEVSENQVICYTSEGKSAVFSGIYKGEARYGFILDNEIYIISLSKSYFGKWVVDNCSVASYEE